MNSKLKIFIALGLLAFLCFNTYHLITANNPLTQAKRQALSLSRGDRYFGRLSIWRYFIRRSDWNQASQLALHLDPADTKSYLSLYSPDFIKQSLNRLIFKSGKTADDYLEIARSYTRLGDLDQARKALSQAYSLDPIRDDVSRLYYQYYRQ